MGTVLRLDRRDKLTKPSELLHLPLMAKANPKLQCLLAQSALRSLHQF